ncbi:MAG: hypothetical protein NC331_06520 [Lachnospiraceae bacterium]|nr:hypothetical protein [Lachnospiraceae bacterium]MCM1239025.1 hypothetical protein [Lachnospiraceae bacterium]
MAIKTLYTAVGRFERKTNGCGRCCPVIILGKKEYMVDIQEMVIWTCLNWRIARMEDIGAFYAETIQKAGHITDRPWKDCVERLLIRGLLVSGNGDTEYAALYDLLSSLYIIPTNGPFMLRIASFLKLTLFKHVPFSAARKLFRRDIRTEKEKQVMDLARQALLSTAEIIQCMEKGLRILPDEESIVEKLYDDPYTTSDNISYVVQNAPGSQAVTLAVANLYLRQQIIFERI